MMMTRSPGSRISRSGLPSPAWVCSVKSQCGAHAGGLDHAAQRFLAPTPARLVGVQHHAELLGFPGQGLVGVGEGFELLSNLAQRGGLGALGLLEALLVGLQMLLEGFDERRDLLFSLRQIAFGGLLERRERLDDALDERRLHLFERLLAQRAESGALVRQGLGVGVARLAQGVLVQPFQVRQQLLRGLGARLGLGLRAERLGHLAAQFAQLFLPLRELLAQLVRQPLVRGRRAAAPLNQARQKTECGPNEQTNERVNRGGHGDRGIGAVPRALKPAGASTKPRSILRDDFDLDPGPFGEARHLDRRAGRENRL